MDPAADLPLENIPNNKLPDVEQKHVDQLPGERPGDWHIEMRYLPLAHRGHAFLALVDPSGNVQRELHGLARSTLANSPLSDEMEPIWSASNRLGRTWGAQFPSPECSGDYEDVVRGKWRTGLQAAVDMNRKNLDYKGHDPSYEAGTNGGEIQNSNSANFTFGKPMHLDLSTAIRNKGLDRVFPGWGRDVLDPTYRPYVAPPMFPPNMPP